MANNFVSMSSLYHGDGVPVQVTTTANHHYFEHLAGNTIVYDQPNEMLIAVRRTNGQYSTSNNEFEMYSLSKILRFSGFLVVSFRNSSFMPIAIALFPLPLYPNRMFLARKSKSLGFV